MVDDKESDTSLTNEDMDLFHSYYGIASSPRGEEGGDPMSLDSSEFQAMEYVVSELQNLKVGELLEKDADLMHDIRNLDSDMQMLVYENYNKFIAATETIKRMKNNVEDMDSDMSSIDTNMQRISSGSSRLDGSLAAKRNKVEKLVRVHRLLERLQFLSGLPEKLRSMVKRESFEDAVQLYKTSSKILQQYSHVLSFSNIEKECITIMESLQNMLLDKLAEPLIEFKKRLLHIGVLRAIVEDAQEKELSVYKKLLSIQSNRTYMLIDLLDREVAGIRGNVEITTVKKIYRLVVLNLMESVHITFAANEKENKKGLAKIMFESTSSSIKSLRKSLSGVLQAVCDAPNSIDKDQDVDKIAQSKLMEECIEFLKSAVMDMSYVYSHIKNASNAIDAPPPPTWHQDLATDFLRFVRSNLDSCMKNKFEDISTTISRGSKAIENSLLSANLANITDSTGSNTRKLGDITRLEGDEVHISISDSLRSNISTIATRAAPRVKDIVDSTMSSFEDVLDRIRPLYDLYKAVNFGALEQSQKCVVDLIFDFFDRLVEVVIGASIGYDQPYFCVDIYASIFTEQMLDRYKSATINVTSVMCSAYLRELTIVMSPQVLSLLEKSQCFHLSSQSDDITKNLMTGMHKINECLLRTANYLMIDYVESVANRMAKLLTEEGNFECSPADDASVYQVSKGAIAAAVELDHSMLTLCTFLDIIPPTSYSKTLVLAEVGSKKRQNPSRQQIDIDKLFADPVVMMPLMTNEKAAMPFSKHDENVHFSGSSLRQNEDEDGREAEREKTSLGCMIAKVALKSSIEIIRSRPFISTGASFQLRGDISFLRMICEALIDDIEDVHTVADLYETTIDEKTVSIE